MNLSVAPRASPASGLDVPRLERFRELRDDPAAGAGRLALNPDTGEAVEWDGSTWTPLPMAQDPDTGKRVYFRGGSWVALDVTGLKPLDNDKDDQSWWKDLPVVEGKPEGGGQQRDPELVRQLLELQRRGPAGGADR